jgi:hypothetical protein
MSPLGRGLAAAVLILSACDSKDEEKKGAKHEHRAPHGGTLVELGGEFAHLEIVLDAASGQLTAYVLDGEAETSIRLEQEELALSVKGKTGDVPVLLKAVGSTLTGEKPGDTSQFEGQLDALRGQKDFDASVVAITVKGRKFGNVSFNVPRGNEAK